MKKLILMSVFILVFIIASVMPALAQRGDDTKRASKNGKVEGTIDGVKVTVEYGSPNVKERKIWGGLVPFDKIWRTGANEASTFTVDKDVTVEGKKLAAGTYGLFTIPGEMEWTFIFNKVAKQWGTGKYDAAQDALRIKVKPKKAEHVEAMTFKIDGKHVILLWEKLAVGFAVAAAK